MFLNFVFLYFFVCVFVYLYLYFFICICVFVFVYLYPCICTCVFKFVYLFLYICIFVYLYFCIFVFVYLCICVCVFDFVYLTQISVLPHGSPTPNLSDALLRTRSFYAWGHFSKYNIARHLIIHHKNEFHPSYKLIFLSAAHLKSSYCSQEIYQLTKDKSFYKVWWKSLKEWCWSLHKALV